MRSFLRSSLVALGATALLVAAWSGDASGHPAGQARPGLHGSSAASSLALGKHGLIYRGLVRARSGPCRGVFAFPATRTSSLHPWSRPVAGRDRRSQSTVATRAPRARSRQSAQGRRFDNWLLPRRQRRAGHLCASGRNRRLLDLCGVSAGVRRRCRFGLPGKRSRAGGFEAITVGYRRVVQSDHPRRHHLTERVRRFHDDDRRAGGTRALRTRLASTSCGWTARTPTAGSDSTTVTRARTRATTTTARSPCSRASTNPAGACWQGPVPTP